ncbi:MAG: peptidoglycan-binding protein [Actinomycetota bacterium]|nr:peptidoglycan-binding protein [Actinomycetota bacterium]
MRRTTTFGLILAAVVISAGAGWFAGSRIKSPAQVAAETEPPTPSLITVPVEMRTLSSDVITRGEIRYEEPVELQLADPPATLGGAAIVTLAPEEGMLIEEGEVLLEVSGRPILVLRGELPMYRTTRPGDEGDDVLQLEEALRRLGLDPGEVDGVFDDATEAAIIDWYGSHGFVPPGPNEQEAADLKAASEAVAAAEQEVSSAKRDLSSVSQGPSQAGILSAEADVRSAERELEDARARRAADDAAATVAVDAAAAQAEQAAADLATADDRLAQALAGTHPDTGLPPTEEELVELETAVADAASLVDAAEAALLDAQQQRDEISPSGASAVAAAEDRVAIAKAFLEEAKRPQDTSGARGYVSDAKQRLADAQESLEEVEARVGTIASRSELVCLKELPARIDRVRVARGDAATGPIASITGSEMILASSVPLADASLVREGMAVVIEETWQEIETTGVIAFKADRPGTNDVGDERLYLEITLDEEMEELNHENVKVVIPVQSTGGDVMAVPVAALAAAADGSSRVQVEDGDETTRFVVVETGLAAGGYVEIASADGPLDAGDRVVVGREAGEQGEETEQA